jgi:hypothetical protein
VGTLATPPTTVGSKAPFLGRATFGVRAFFALDRTSPDRADAESAATA